MTGRGLTRLASIPTDRLEEINHACWATSDVDAPGIYVADLLDDRRGHPEDADRIPTALSLPEVEDIEACCREAGRDDLADMVRGCIDSDHVTDAVKADPQAIWTGGPDA